MYPIIQITVAVTQTPQNVALRYVSFDRSLIRLEK